MALYGLLFTSYLRVTTDWQNGQVCLLRDREFEPQSSRLTAMQGYIFWKIFYLFWTLN